MTRTSATDDGRAVDLMVAGYAEYARGGWGLVTTEATYIDEKCSQGYHHQPGIANDAQQDSWRPVVEASAREGADIFMQVCQAGALSQGNQWVAKSIAPSPVC